MHFVKPHRLLCFAAVVAGFLRFTGCAPGPPIGAGSRERYEWVEKTLKRLTLDQKVEQMVMARAYGYYYSDESDEYRRLERLVRDHRLGGLIFFQGDVYETAELINRLQKLADVPLLIGSDFEWGSAMRIRRATRFPEAMALGAAGDTSLAYEMGRAVAQEARAIGVEQVFAPVADVNVNPNNPVINTRSFGADPMLVAGMSVAFASGLQAEGVLATAKHFPGHGDTQIDSHLDLPRISVSRERLDSVELYPFRQLIARGVSSMMIAHLEVPAVERSPGLPATLSHSIVHGLLQEELRFGGLVVTDAMDMGALVRGFGADSSAVRAVEAGNDVLLIPAEEDRAVGAVAGAVRSGRIAEERINGSVRKILNYKWDLGLAKNRLVDPGRIPQIVATPAHLSLAKQIARRSITLLKNDSLLPMERFGKKKLLCVTVADAEDYRTEIQRPSSQWTNEPVGDYFFSQLRKRYGNYQTARINPSSNSMDFDSVMMLARHADIVLCTIYSKARSGSGQFGLSRETIDCVTLLASRRHTILVSMGSPYVLAAFPNASAYLCSYSDAEVSTEAVMEVLFGEVPASGRLPTALPDLFPYGAGIDLAQDVVRTDVPEAGGFRRDSLDRLDLIMRKAITDSAFPGGQLLVARSGILVYNKSFGSLEYDRKSPRVNSNTLYDLASLTKVVATTSAVMKLYDDGRIQLDDPVVRYIPAFGNRGKEKITIRNLMLHNGGLPPFKLLYLTCSSPQQVLDSVYRTELIYPTGDSTVYSDFDFIVLGKIVEKISGATLDRFVDSTFFKPLAMTRTMFKPPASLVDNVAPTELDTVFRKQLVRGVVHDENAFALGGVSGHAGLFSTASDLAVFMQMLMNGGRYGGKRLLKPETVRLFTTKQRPKSTRGLGWDTKTVNGYSSAGSLFSEQSFGHTGYTGTSVWADPDKNLFVILLTNRVYPTRANTKIMQVRPSVHDAVVRALAVVPPLH